MDLPLSDQIIALIRTALSMAVAVVTVLGFMRYGFTLASAYFAVGLAAFTSMQLALGRTLRPRNTTTTPTTTDDTD